MKFVSSIFIILLVVTGNLAAQADTLAAPEDTLIQEPRDADDLPEAVIKWLETRDLLIPFYGENGYRQAYENTLIGSFIGEESTDCAVLTLPRGGFEDSCSIWVFPAGDTLAPMLIAKHRVYRSGGSQWQRSYAYDFELEYIWCIRPYGPYSETDLRNRRIDPSGIPKMTHQGIFVLHAEKDPYPYYYYNGSEWIKLPLGQ